MKLIAGIRIGLSGVATTSVVRGAMPEAAPRPRVARRPRHCMLPVQDGWRCSGCRRRTVTKERACKLERLACSGAPKVAGMRLGTKAGANGAGRGHQLREAHDFLVCEACGAYSRKVVAGLGRDCTGPLVPGAPSQRSRFLRRGRLLEGRHPLTGELLAGLELL